jgi:hypothetical protein
MLTALLPVFIIILLGYLFKQTGFPGDSFWLAAEKITYFVFFPALLINKLAFATFDAAVALPMAASLVLSVLCLSSGLLFFQSRNGMAGPQFSSIFQGTIRFNTFVGLAGASALLGSSGLTLAAVALVGMIPIINLICVPTVAHFGMSHGAHFGRLLLEIVRNPLILGCVIGFALNLTPVPKPEGVFRVFDLLGRAALPIGLLAVGAGLRIQSLNAHVSGLVLASGLKLLAFPCLTAAFCLLLGVHGEARTVAVLFAALPTAVSSFILARQLGGDTTLMASIITVQTIVSAGSIPLVLYLFAA